MKLFKISLFATLLLTLFIACTPEDTIEFLAGTPTLTQGETNKILTEVSYQNIFSNIFKGANSSGSKEINQWTKIEDNYTEIALIITNKDNIQIILRKKYTNGINEEVKKYYSFSENGSTNLSMTIIDGSKKIRTFRSGSELNTFISQFKRLNDFYTFKF